MRQFKSNIFFGTKTKLIATLAIMLTVGFLNTSFGQVLPPSSVTTSGSYNNSDTLIYDGVFPAEGSVWTGATNMWWQGQTGTSGVVSVFDYGAVFNINDVEMSFDNNDTYNVDWSLDGSSWNSLFSLLSSYGEIGNGMDTFSSISSSPEYISQIDFAPVQAQFLRVYAVSGDNLYSIGELQASGTVVPEPVMLPMLAGLVCLMATNRRRR